MASLLRYSNIPFLVCWGSIAFVVARIGQFSLPWSTRSPCDVTRRPARAAIAAVVLFAFLYQDAVRRTLAGHWALGAPMHAMEVIVFAPVVEEMLFRGIAWQSCVRWTRALPRRRAVLIVVAVTSLAFSAWHLRLSGNANVVGHALFGVAMAFTRLASGRLWPCVALHAAGNALTLVYA